MHKNKLPWIIKFNLLESEPKPMRIAHIAWNVCACVYACVRLVNVLFNTSISLIVTEFKEFSSVSRCLFPLLYMCCWLNILCVLCICILWYYCEFLSSAHLSSKYVFAPVIQTHSNIYINISATLENFLYRIHNWIN